MKNERRGMGLVEILMAIALMTMLLSLVVYVFYYSGKSQKMTDQLDAFHEARMVDFSLSAELKFSTGILHPLLPESGAGPSATVNQVIFRDALNQVKAVFLTPKKELVLLNYERIVGSQIAPPRVLGRNVERFEVKVQPSRLVEYRAVFLINNQEHEIVNQLLPVNQL